MLKLQVVDDSPVRALGKVEVDEVFSIAFASKASLAVSQLDGIASSVRSISSGELLQPLDSSRLVVGLLD
jgi:hypothetical protein